MTFEFLLGEYHVPFLGSIMGRSAIRVDGPPDKWRDLVSWQDLNRLLNYGALSYPRVRFVNSGKEIPQTTYTLIGANGYPRLIVPAVRAAMMSGATMVIDAAEQLHEPLASCCQVLEEHLRVPVQSRLYATSAASDETSVLHRNDQEAFLVQIEGITQWELHRPDTPGDSDGKEPPPPVGAPVWRGTLVNGQALYVPKGWWYREQHGDGPALYASLTFRNLTAMDFVKRLTNHLDLSHRMRADFPRFGGAAEQDAFLRLVQKEIGEACGRPGLILGCLQESQCFSEPRTHFALPWTTDAKAILDAEGSLIEWRIRFPGIDVLKHLDTEDGVELFLDGRPLKFCGNTAFVLERILNRPASTVGEVIAFCGALSREQVATSLIDLMNHDVIFVRLAESF